MAATRREELEGKDLRIPRRKVLRSLEAHWHALTLFVDHLQIPMDNNGAERAVRPAAIARKNFSGSGAKWSGELMAMLMSLFQTLLLHQVDPRKYLTAYLQACADNALPRTPRAAGLPGVRLDQCARKTQNHELQSRPPAHAPRRAHRVARA